jgi:predicted nucleotidyltransferase
MDCDPPTGGIMTIEAANESDDARDSNITGAIVDLLEARGVQTYAVRRNPSSIVLSLPNEPEAAVERHVQALRGRLQEVAFQRRPDVVCRDPRDEHAIIVEMKAAGDRGSDRDTVIRVLQGEETELRRRGVERLVLFGSTATQQPHPNDVDVLVRFRPGSRPSVYDIAELQLHLEEKLGRRVDVSTESTFPTEFTKIVEQNGIEIFGS